MHQPTLLLAFTALAAPALAQNCANTSTGNLPLTDMAGALYLNQFEGGLYPGGSNAPPASHHASGLARASAIIPRNTAGSPDPAGTYILLSVGMSNTTQEFCGGNNNNCSPISFMGQAAAHPAVNHTALTIIDGASGGQAAAQWTSPQSPNYDRIRDQILAPRNLSELQVQIVWVKQANAGPQHPLPHASADAYILLQHLGAISRTLKLRYPNLQQVYFSSRIYGGYATTALNPEPFPYEGGFAVKWLIESQIRQHAGLPLAHPFTIPGNLEYAAPTASAPWLAWGPYLWADGTTPRADGLVWNCTDFAPDGVHPGPAAREKVGAMLLNFFLTSPYSAPWFRAEVAPCYANCDGSTLQPILNIDDFTCFINEFAAAHTLHGCVNQGNPNCYPNCDGSTTVPFLNVDDFTCFINAYALGCP